MQRTLDRVDSFLMNLLYCSVRACALVYTTSGRSRSTTIVLAYMLIAASKEGNAGGIDLPEAFATVKGGRHSVCPNFGFWMYVDRWRYARSTRAHLRA